jgi:histidinol-phosphate aminotransferase
VGDDLRLYPDPIARELRQRAAEIYGVSPEQIVAGNGSDDLLAMLFRLTLDGAAGAAAGDRVAYPVPTYSLYDTLAAIQGAEACRVPFGDDFVLPADELLARDAQLYIVCNPNSPSGTLTKAADIDRFAARTRALVVVDEAYVDFARETCLPLLAERPNVVVLRTFSKSYSLAGMRIGLAFGSREIIGELNKVKDSYNLNRLSLVAARAALEDQAWMRANVERIRSARRKLVAALAELGFSVPPSEANFVLARRPGTSMAPTYRRLKEEGVLVRYFEVPGLTDALRITVGLPEENDALVEALRRLA